MKGIKLLIIFQIIISAVSAWLLAQMSFLGKIGISLFYKEYQILRNPWQTGAMLIGIQLFVILILWIFYRGFGKKATHFMAILVIILALVGLGYTIYDFQEEFSHKMLKTKFHIGGYLIWVGMMVSGLFFLLKNKRTLIENDPET